MKKYLFTKLFLLLCAGVYAQEIVFEEYDLPNGMHVILHQDTSAPLVVTSVMYHVGAKDENPNRTGFAHFFEHLLFEGTKHIKRKEWFKIVSENGGNNNANTSNDRTYYYEQFPSNNLKLGLWMESERMLHPKITQEGVDTQNEVVKEEKRMRYDNQPYGKMFYYVHKYLFKKHPYRWTTIGKMEHLDAASLEEFRAFNKKFYVPNNAVLVVAGDFKKSDAKKWISDYFGTIPRGKDIKHPAIKEKPIKKQIKRVAYDSQIQLPALIKAWRIPAFKGRDGVALDMISTYLSDGKSSPLYKRLVDKEQLALQVQGFPIFLEDYGMYVIFTIPRQGKKISDNNKAIEAEIKKLQTDLISERAFEKLKNTIEKIFVDQYGSLEGVAERLAWCYTTRKNTNFANEQINLYRSITREDIREAARKYLNPNQSLYLEYLPKKK